jgi:hypothetical protein
MSDPKPSAIIVESIKRDLYRDYGIDFENAGSPKVQHAVALMVKNGLEQFERVLQAADEDVEFMAARAKRPARGKTRTRRTQREP